MNKTFFQASHTH